MDWAKISMMHDESCLLVSSMQWRSRLNPQSSKLHATSFEVVGALTSGLQSHRAVSCVFHPKMVAFFDTKMVNLKGIKGTKSVFLKQN